MSYPCLSTYFNQFYEDKYLRNCHSINTQKGALMILVGIDIIKLNHFASALSSNGEVMLQPFNFINDYDDSYLLVQRLDSFDSN